MPYSCATVQTYKDAGVPCPLGTLHCAHPFNADTLSVPYTRAAVQMYKDAGVPTRQFVGVPVFQAEGLTVTTRDMVGGGRGVAVGVHGRLCVRGHGLQEQGR